MQQEKMIPLNPLIPDRPLRVMSFTHLADWLSIQVLDPPASKAYYLFFFFLSIHRLFNRSMFWFERSGEKESEEQVNNPGTEMTTDPNAHGQRRDGKTTFPFKSRLKGTPDDSRTTFDTVVMPAAVIPDNRASESPCCAVVFNLMHF